jgi:hypothetical protein
MLAQLISIEGPQGLPGERQVPLKNSPNLLAGRTMAFDIPNEALYNIRQERSA